MAYISRFKYPDGLPLSWIPNQEGFQFIGITKDGKEISCTVVKDCKGMHHIKECSVVNLKGWRNL